MLRHIVRLSRPRRAGFRPFRPSAAPAQRPSAFFHWRRARWGGTVRFCMDIEFHYYITHLIAARAGVRNEALRILPHACQLTDDNDRVYAVREGRRGIYRNRISQTLRPLNSHRERLAVYPLFHFIPGDPMPRASHARTGGRTRSTRRRTAPSPTGSWMPPSRPTIRIRSESRATPTRTPGRTRTSSGSNATSTGSTISSPA